VDIDVLTGRVLQVRWQVFSMRAAALLLVACVQLHAYASSATERCFSATRRAALHREALRGAPRDFYNGGHNGKTWYQNNAEPSLRCLTDERLGPFGDGGKWVCQPECLLQQDECYVLSVGSNNDFGFETALARYGCSIHVFDHTVKNPTPPTHVRFHSFGIGVRSGGQIKTLREIVALTKAPGIIDIFKIDCEFCEYDVFDDEPTLQLLQTSVRQLLVEIHFRSDATSVRLFEKLTNAGFRAFSKEANIIACDGSCAGECIEYSFLNMNLLPKYRLKGNV
jgi:hypothetical protein